MGRARRTFWTTDSETLPFKVGRSPQPFIWGAYEGDSEQYEKFETVAQVAEFFEQKRTTVYAHNGGKFDYMARERCGRCDDCANGRGEWCQRGDSLREHINSDEPVLVINGRLAKFKIGQCEFRDSLNLFPNTRLKDFNDESGRKLEIDYALMEEAARADPNVMFEIERYLRQDCVKLWNVIRRYWDQYGKALTQAGASMKYWERRFGMEAPRQTKAAHARYKPYYYGGRVQCFREGVESCNFQVADINSAYPRAMLEKHAFSTEAIIEKHLPADHEIFRCLIKVDAVSRGAFPWRDDDGELFFPDDEAGNRNRVRTYNITGWELLTALELDAVKIFNVREVHYFPEVIDFRDYINHFYEERENARKRGDVAGRVFAKYFMNSLYGKFGADCEKYREYIIASDDSVAKWLSEGYREYKRWGHRFLLERPIPEDRERYYNVATAASVTGWVRAFLFRSMHKCSGLIYCDTDSIAARDVSGLEFGNALGQWKHELDADMFAIGGKKLYAFHKAGALMEYDPKQEPKDRSWKVASKGVNFTERADGPDLIRTIANGGTIKYEPEVPCYTITREAPRFINRNVAKTYKDARFVPEYVSTDTVH